MLRHLEISCEHDDTLYLNTSACISHDIKCTFLCEICQNFLFKIDLSVSVKEQHKDRNRFFILLIHFSKTCNSQVHARLKPRARNSVSHIGSGVPNTWATAFLVTLAGIRVRSRTARIPAGTRVWDAFISNAASPMLA